MSDSTEYNYRGFRVERIEGHSLTVYDYLGRVAIHFHRDSSDRMVRQTIDDGIAAGDL